ncbi:PLDc N-terminal domain-containing protein [Tropicimonas isoalkanivorans]|uniref:Phospholipase_D-nuclease N-terminal n=1 Tax=Tropicimonas isoalkanivorans TaxID=441112 RepID=A0A1I1PKF4_9RHOB|nr:PLDc N-terminal domain-containing protein [Tropicimonas isoalkanivorans]SFD10305.1 Phospholipase_D-nuclease N-terminal [Tropicimonas isoalkanivorans]
MFDLGGLFGLILLALDIWAIISIVGSGETTGKKVLWVLLVVILPLIGFIIWLVAGPRSARTAP